RLEAGVLEVAHRAPASGHRAGDAQQRGEQQRQRPWHAQAAGEADDQRRHQQQPGRCTEGDRHAGERQGASERAARQGDVRAHQDAGRLAGVAPRAQRGARGRAELAHGLVDAWCLVGPRLALPRLGHGAYLSPLRASLAMIQPAAKATPNEASGRSRISSEALSIRSRLLSMSASICSRLAAPACSSAAMPDSALSARSPLTWALPRRISSPAAEAAPLIASPACPAASLRWLPVWPRLDFMLSVALGDMSLSFDCRCYSVRDYRISRSPRLPPRMIRRTSCCGWSAKVRRKPARSSKRPLLDAMTTSP